MVWYCFGSNDKGELLFFCSNGEEEWVERASQDDGKEVTKARF
jgi:hypothetical protein